MAEIVAAASTAPSDALRLTTLSEREAFELGQYEKIIQLRDFIISRKDPTATLHRSSNVSLGSIPPQQNGTDSKARPLEFDGHDSAPAVPSQPKVATKLELNTTHAEKSDQALNAELQIQRQRLERALKEEAEQIRLEKAVQVEPCAELDSSDVLAKALVLVQATAAPAVEGESLNAKAESTNDSFDESTFYSSRHDTPESHLVSLIRNSSQDVLGANGHPQHEEVSQRISTRQQAQPSSGPAGDFANTALPPSTTERSNFPIRNAKLTSQVKSSDDVQAADAHPQFEGIPQRDSKQQPSQPSSGLDAVPAQDTQPPPTTERSNHSLLNRSLTSQMSIVPGLNNYVQATSTSKDRTQTVASGVASRVDAPRQDDSRTSISRIPMSSIQGPRDSFLETHPPSPLVRNHNTLQPVAPQPTHPSSISALTAASSAIHDSAHAAGPCSTVATLTQGEQNGVTSPESSSQGGKKKGKKKKKKKKRKAETQGGVGTENLPVIKQEPRSPSPLNAVSYIRPSKRARYAPDQSAVHDYEPRYDAASAHDTGVQYVSRSARDHAMPVGPAATASYQPPYNSAATGDSRYDSGGYYDEQATTGEGPRHHEGRVADHRTPYLSRMAPAPVPAPVPQAVLADSRPISSRPYRDFQDGIRLSAHPEAETFMAPSRPAPARILVDGYGREFIEPSHHIPSRLSVAPPSRHGEHEVIYERLPPRAVSRHPVPGTYEDGSLIYSAPTQTYALPRRIMTQPGYANHDYRDIRQREFSSRSQPPQGEFVQALAPNERRYGEDGYGARPASDRPVDNVRYPIPPDYGQVNSARPELPVAAEYRASVHPDGRRETIQPYMRGYHAAPAQEPAIQRAYSVRPPDSSQGGQLRGVDEIAFIERPSGASQEIVYADDARRGFFR